MFAACFNGVALFLLLNTHSTLSALSGLMSNEAGEFNPEFCLFHKAKTYFCQRRPFLMLPVCLSVRQEKCSLNLVPSRLRRARRMAALLSGAFLAGAGAAHAQTYATTIVAPSQTQVFQFTTTTTTASPTYNRVAIADGVNDYSKTTPTSSGIGAAVTYATSNAFTPTQAGTYTVSTSTSGFDPGNFIQYIYQPTLVATTAMTALQGVKYGYFADNTSNNGSYNVSLTGATPYQFVNAGYYSNNATYPQVPGNSYYSEGTVTTTVLLDDPGSTSSIPDNSTSGVSQVLTVTDLTNIASFNSITIDGLKDPFIGDLVATLSHNGVSVDLFDHTGANNVAGTPGYNYGQGSAASFDGQNYTFALSGTDLASIADFATAPDGSVYAASGNAANGFDSANAANTLNSFTGQSVAGAWTLTIKDQQPDDTGSFTGFSFNINNAAVPEASTGIGFGLLLGFVVLGRAGMTLRARRRSAQATLNA